MVARLFISVMVCSLLVVWSACNGDESPPDAGQVDDLADSAVPSATALPATPVATGATPVSTDPTSTPAVPPPVTATATSIPAGTSGRAGDYREGQAARFAASLIGEFRTIVNADDPGVPQRKVCIARAYLRAGDEASDEIDSVRAGHDSVPASGVITEIGTDVCAGWAFVEIGDSWSSWILLRHLDAPDTNVWDGPAEATWGDLFATLNATDQACTEHLLTASELQEAATWPLFGDSDRARSLPTWSLILGPCIPLRLAAGLTVRNARIFADQVGADFAISQERCLAPYALEHTALALLAPDQRTVWLDFPAPGLARCAPNVYAALIGQKLTSLTAETLGQAFVLRTGELGCIAASERDLDVLASSLTKLGSEDGYSGPLLRFIHSVLGSSPEDVETSVNLVLRCAEAAWLTFAVGNLEAQLGPLSPAGVACMQERGVTRAMLVASVSGDVLALARTYHDTPFCSGLP